LSDNSCRLNRSIATPSKRDVAEVSEAVLQGGAPSIAPERLLRSLLLQIFYSVRSERMLIEQLQYNLLFRWFVGMEMEETMACRV
jgi:transposase